MTNLKYVYHDNDTVDYRMLTCQSCLFCTEYTMHPLSLTIFKHVHHVIKSSLKQIRSCWIKWLSSALKLTEEINLLRSFEPNINPWLNAYNKVHPHYKHIEDNLWMLRLEWGLSDNDRGFFKIWRNDYSNSQGPWKIYAYCEKGLILRVCCSYFPNLLNR